jgi:excisionase family DNA binding protein
MKQEEWLTTEQAAGRLQLSPITVQRWLKDGRLQGTLLSRKAGWRIPAREVERILTEGLGKPKEGAR